MISDPQALPNTPELAQLLRPRLTRYIPHLPTPRQAAFLCLPHLEAFYGGAAGGGKSDALLMAALQYADVPQYSALLVRETYPMLTQPGGLLDRAREWLAPTDARWSASDHQWRFPSGATLTFRHLRDAGAERNFQGAEYHFIGIDEVTDFTESEYRFLFSRLRRRQASELPVRMRATSNPYGPGREWTYRWFILEGAEKDRIYIPARLEDNPHLDQESYERSLRQLGPVVYRQLRHGDWTIRPEGELFNADWFEGCFIDKRALPDDLSLCRYWDLAAREPRPGTDPDYTAGVLLAHESDALWYVINVRRVRSSSLEVERLIRQSAEEDAAWAKDHTFDPPAIRMEQEPGASGISLIEHYGRSVLEPYDFKGIRTTGPKTARALPLAARAEAKQIRLCRGAWNTALLDELVSFPSGAHDDQVDALAGAYEELATRQEYISVPWPDLWCPNPFVPPGMAPSFDAPPI